MLPEIDIHAAQAGLRAMQGLRVMVVGETIIDEYAFCDAIGKSGKEPMLVTRALRCEAQAGGVLAVANHIAQFCRHVEVVSALGSHDSRESFVRAALAPNVRQSFATKSGPTIVKRRYVDAYTKAKMLGVYQIDPAPLAGDELATFRVALQAGMERADMVVVVDYGHGLLADDAVEQLCSEAPFLALNTQLNAANTGYHVLSRYRRADYACVHEGELRLDARNLHGELRPLIVQARERMGARAVMVTRGKHGTWLNTPGGDAICPALATEVVERVGAGDAVLAVSSVAVAAGLSPGLTSVMANLAGAQAVAQLGNHAAIQKTALVERLLQLADAQRRAG